MTVTVLCQTGVVQTLPTPVQASAGATPGSNLPLGSQAANFLTAGAGTTQTPPTNQAYQVTVTGGPGNVSATIQPLASNDGINWASLGSPIIVAAGASPQTALATASQNFAFFSAYCTQISGTGALVTCTLNC